MLRLYIHASAWEATAGADAPPLSPSFQSTPPRGRRPDAASLSQAAALFQSTPPRGRRRAETVDALTDSAISIHASAWEATIAAFFFLCNLRDFNPRLRVGGDPVRQERR